VELCPAAKSRTLGLHERPIRSASEPGRRPVARRLGGRRLGGSEGDGPADAQPPAERVDLVGEHPLGDRGVGAWMSRCA
jgi:hypothetical protein